MYLISAIENKYVIRAMMGTNENFDKPKLWECYIGLL